MRASRRRRLLRLGLLVGLLACASVAPADAAEGEAPIGDPDAKAFGPATLAEILDAVRERHLAPLLEAPRPWVAGANGALSLLRPPRLLVEAKMLARGVGRWPGYLGRGEPLRCGGPPRQDVVLLPRDAMRWRPPWRDQLPPLAFGQTTSREYEVEIAASFAAPFAEPDLRCVISLVLEQLEIPRHADVWRRAANWFLRAHDVHSRLAEERLWQAVNRAETSHAELGLTLRWHEQRWQISGVSKGGAASAAGILAEDWLVAVDGKTTVGMKQNDLAQRLDRKPGTTIRMGVQTGDAAPRTAKLVVREVRELDVTAAPIVGEKDAVVVRVQKFAPGGDERLAAALRPAKGKPPRVVVLDLRGNGGGIMPVALRIIGHFVGPLAAARVTTRDGSATVDADPPEGGKTPAALAVLIDAGCASACELTTAALRHHRGAVVFGQPSYGKATLQDAIPLQRGPGRLMLTIGRFDAADGAAIQAVGVQPDVVIPLGRSKGPREGDLDFVLRVPDAPLHPRAPAASPALRRCVAKLPMPQRPADADDPEGGTPAERSAKRLLVRWAAAVARCTTAPHGG